VFRNLPGVDWPWLVRGECFRGMKSGVEAAVGGG
jgi:hypothetical protein